jgi:hypothetical protein
MDGAATGGPDRRIGWLGSPPGATWPGPDDGPAEGANPFVAFRTLLWSHHAALAAGWSDDRFVDLVRRLDDAVADVDGHGFATTPYRHLTALGDAIGQTGGIWAKDETGNVSGSHKARHLFGLALHLAVDEVPSTTPLAIASCGNAAMGAAVIAGAVGRPLVVHVPTWADDAVLDRLADLGADVRVCRRRDGEAGDQGENSGGQPPGQAVVCGPHADAGEEVGHGDSRWEWMAGKSCRPGRAPAVGSVGGPAV